MSDSLSPTRPRPLFLSYAREDAPAAKRICDALRGFGVEVWFDMNELRGGDAWDAKIRHQIRTCGLFLPIISATTQSRGEGYFRREWRTAVERMNDIATGIAFLIPIVIDGTTETDALVPDEFRRVHWTFLKDGNPSPEFVSQVKQLLDNPRAVIAAPAAPSRVSSSSQAAVAPAKKKSPWPVVAVAALVAVVAVVFLLRKPETAPALPATPTAPAAAPVAAKPAVSDKSVAVLPFTNMSAEKDTAFFADGVHEDLLTNLALIHELRVVSRTSVMQYRDTTKPIPEIARELGVAFILEGSVQRSGNRVRVTGQLIKAATDEHVWAQSYDRDLTDAFAIQSDLATQIATALQTEISPQEKALIAAKPTENTAAYDLYLKARTIFNSFGPTPENLAQQETLLQAAVQLDPKFAEAWGEIADIHAIRVFNFDDATLARQRLAKEAIDQAVALAPENPHVITCLGTYYYYAYRDYDRALAQYERLRKLQPNSAVISFSIGLIERRRGQWKASCADLRAACEKEPGNANYWLQYADACSASLRLAEAVEASSHALELNPDSVFAQVYFQGNQYVKTRDPAAIRAYLATIPAAVRDTPNFLGGEGNLLLAIGDVEGYLATDRKLQGRSPLGLATELTALSPAFVLFTQGDRQAAIKRLGDAPDRVRAQLREQPANALLWGNLGGMEIILGHPDRALEAIKKSIEILPISRDALQGPQMEDGLPFWETWCGDKEKAIDEIARLMRVGNGHTPLDLKFNPQWKPLRGMPRFEALIDDPKNWEPID